MNTRVLVVEDEILVRMFAVDALEDLGFNVSQAGNASDALATLTADRELCAAVVDLGLPDRAGDELVAEMLTLRPDLRILVASGRSEHEIKDRFSGYPHVKLLSKPYTASMLLHALTELGVGPHNQRG